MRRTDPLAHPRPLIDAVYRYVGYRIGDGPEAENVTSAVFDRALRYRESYDPKKGSAIAWLIGIARRELELGRPLAVEHASDLDAMKDALAKLSPAERDLLVLTYGADLPTRRVAEIAGLRTKTAEIATHRALKQLQTVLAESATGRDAAAA